MPNPKRHVVAVLVPEGAVASDFSTPLDLLGKAKTPTGQDCYELKVCGVTKSVRTEYFSIDVPHSIRVLRTADTIIVAGTENPPSESPATLTRALQRANSRGTRIASICTGAFLLAEAGILDGKNATTHWLAAKELAARYPMINVDPNVLFVDNGQVLTSAGAMAAVDLCLHLIQRDFGAAVAAQSARKSVMPLARSGGQAQFIQQEPQLRDYGSLKSLLVWVENNLSDRLEVPVLAERSALSVRTLHRKFVEQTGMTPNAWILQARVRAAQQLLETSRLSIEQISRQTGFGSYPNFRARFKTLVGTNPSSYRRAFNRDN